MRYRAHKVGGLCTGLVVGNLLVGNITDMNSFVLTTLVTGASIFGSVIPDIDEPSSYVGKKVKPISKAIKSTSGHRGLWHSPLMASIITAFLLAMYFFTNASGNSEYTRYFLLIFFGFCCILNIFTILRGWHFPIISLLWTVLSIYLIYIRKEMDLVFLITIFGIFMGYLNHLFMDMLTVSGIPLFYPFSKQKFSLWHFRSGDDDLIVSILFIIPTTIFLVLKYKTIF